MRGPITCVLVCLVGCQGPEGFNHATSVVPTAGAGGHTGAAGAASTGSAGTVGAAGAGSSGGAGGLVGGSLAGAGAAGAGVVMAGASGSATAGAGGSAAGGASGAAGRGGMGGTVGAAGASGSPGTGGTSGAVGTAGVAGTAGTGPAGAAGAAGTTASGAAGSAAAGASGSPATDGGRVDGPAGGGCPGIYCDDFESDATGAMPAGWTRVGGSDGDWEVLAGASRALAQDHAQSSTLRLFYASGAAGAPWSGALSISAQVKVLLAGSSGTTDALVCPRFAAAGDYQCLVLQPGAGARVRTRIGGATTEGPLWPATLTIGATYAVHVSIDAAGAVSASLDGKALGMVTPAGTVAAGFAAVGTQSAEAAFDDLVVTRP